MSVGGETKADIKALVKVCTREWKQSERVAELETRFNACTDVQQRFRLLSEIYGIWQPAHEGELFKLDVDLVVKMLEVSCDRSSSDAERVTVLKACIIAMRCVVWREKASSRGEVHRSVLRLMRETRNCTIRAYAVDLLLLVIDTTLSVELVYKLIEQCGVWISGRVYTIGRDMQQNVPYLLIRLVNAYITALDENAMMYVMRSFEYALDHPDYETRVRVMVYIEILRGLCLLRAWQ